MKKLLVTANHHGQSKTDCFVLVDFDTLTSNLLLIIDVIKYNK